MARRAVLAPLYIVAGLAAGGAGVHAQTGPTVCQCSEQRDFGACIVTQQPGGLAYPGDFPGSAALVSATVNGNDVVYLYIADLFNGFTYRYDGEVNLGILTPNTPFQVFASPLGSSATTGVAFQPEDGALYWAIEDRLISTDLDLRPGSLQLKGTVELERLKDLLGLPRTGSLGGIAFHVERLTFWGVDIVNDVYFEFDGTGKLTGGDQPVHFRSPLANPFGGGAYGNGISYANTGGVSFFDITAGSLIDGGVSQVMRIHASEGGEGRQAFSIGDPSGLFYPLEPALGPHGFISGILYWPSTCNASNHTEILLGIATPNSGSTSRIYQVSADDPLTASLSRLDATVTGNTVKLTWKALTPYGTLELRRRLLPDGLSTSLATYQNFATDPLEHTDRNVGDGLYEYTARVTPPSPSQRKFPDLKRTAIIGRGSIAAHADYRLPARPGDQDPFAVAFIGSSSQVLVADRTTGHAHLFKTDLTSAGTLVGPFAGDALEGGLTTGVDWDPGSDSLVWSMLLDGRTILQRTSLSGANMGARAVVDVPVNIRRHPQLADLAFDASRNELWSVDVENQVAYSFNALGDLTGQSVTAQVPVPRPGGEFGGAVSVVESAGATLVLDYTAGATAGEGQGELVRVSYTRTGAGGGTVGSPSEVLALDLRTILQSALIGGAASAKEGDQGFEYVVGVDTQRLYKLRMDSGLQGKEFRRGEVNNDGFPPNISDPIAILNRLFRGGATLPCEDAADLNDDEAINITDAVILFSYLFGGGAEPPPPFAACGRDFDLPLICAQASCI